MMTLRIIHKRMIPIPMATAATNTVFSLPMKGRFVMASWGLSHTASMISSNPKTLPKSSPNMVENTPQQEMIPARRIFLNRYSRNPPISRHSPCPASPNMNPNKMEYVIPISMVGSSSL